MEILAPKREMFILPEGTVDIEFAKNQPQYRTLPALVTEDGRVVSQWKPDPGDMALLQNGVPITLVLHTFNSQCPHCHGPLGLTPVQLAVGGLDLR